MGGTGAKKGPVEKGPMRYSYALQCETLGEGSKQKFSTPSFSETNIQFSSFEIFRQEERADIISKCGTGTFTC